MCNIFWDDVHTLCGTKEMLNVNYGERDETVEHSGGKLEEKRG